MSDIASRNAVLRPEGPDAAPLSALSASTPEPPTRRHVAGGLGETGSVPRSCSEQGARGERGERGDVPPPPDPTDNAVGGDKLGGEKDAVRSSVRGHVRDCEYGGDDGDGSSTLAGKPEGKVSSWLLVACSPCHLPVIVARRSFCPACHRLFPPRQACAAVPMLGVSAVISESPFVTALPKLDLGLATTLAAEDPGERAGLNALPSDCRPSDQRDRRWTEQSRRSGRLAKPL